MTTRDLFDAAIAGREHRIYELLLEGVDVNSKNEDGQTALHLTIHEDGKWSCQVLIEHGADVNIRDDFGQTPLHLACEREILFAIRLLSNVKSLNPDLQDINGSTPLHLACQNGYDVTVRTILTMLNVNMQIRDLNGQTALHTILSLEHINDRLEMFEALTYGKIDLMVENSRGSSFAELAIKSGEKVWLDRMFEFLSENWESAHLSRENSVLFYDLAQNFLREFVYYGGNENETHTIGFFSKELVESSESRRKIKQRNLLADFGSYCEIENSRRINPKTSPYFNLKISLEEKKWSEFSSSFGRLGKILIFKFEEKRLGSDKADPVDRTILIEIDPAILK